MNYFSNIFGLTTKADPTTENGGLFLAHYLVLKTILGKEITLSDRDVYYEKMLGAYVKEGLYLRSSKHTARTVSQDEIAGFVVGSFILGSFHRHNIWKYVVKHFGNYPATGTKKFYNPGAYYPWAVLAHSSLGLVLWPIYTINLVLSSNKKKQDTSSKLIYFTELSMMKTVAWYPKLLWKYYTWRMEKMYGEKWVKALFDIYFWAEGTDFPLKVLAKEV